MISKSIIFFFIFMNTATANELTVKMTLSPAGSFEAATTKLRGEVLKNGDRYTAENLWVKTEELKTGIDLRDEHFHKHLNYEKFPKITLSNVEAVAGQGSGLLSVCGVSNKINFTYKALSEKQLKASFKVRPSIFKLKEAKYLEIGVDDEVEVVAVLDVK